MYVVVKTNRCVGAGTRLGWKRRGDLVGPDREDPDGGERERVVKSDDARSPFWGRDVVILLGIACLEQANTGLALSFRASSSTTRGWRVGAGMEGIAVSTPASERRSNPGRGPRYGLLMW